MAKTSDLGKYAKNVERPIQETLKFIQQNFNTTGSGDFSDIIKNLELASQIMKPGLDERTKREAEVIKRQAERLIREIPKITIIADTKKYKKFDNLTQYIEDIFAGNSFYNSLGIQGVYKVSNDIINDTNTARDWLKTYKEFEKKFRNSNIQNEQKLHSELLILGKSILARAVELCPIDTGYLRSTGVLIDQGTSITIAFLAPYASYVHENLAIHHPWHIIRSGPERGMQYDCGGRAKFLEIALQEFFPDKSVWTEIHGYEGVSATISINPVLLKYSHYD